MEKLQNVPWNKKKKIINSSAVSSFVMEIDEHF